ncbi:SDR family oxidoreductase [Galbibacter sp. BG1]|uniref:SDR family NAD(P)-dependent oxidoreductase n=1 Tax=Galbibacter sp. BG1 TaxID=1170699 RepID=UPI0015C187F1|nr:SDR family oxidoreductase [Galbibacter sp. BG1]QLE02606.1 SDR family oxidoreductase [Galbibacter sp. BG1]
MNQENKNKDYWALILGGSSGLGLASAKKLAKDGYNIVVVHRDRRADLAQIEEAFKDIRSHNVVLKSFNVDATNSDKRKAVIDEILKLIELGKIKVLLNSIAKGNLKPMFSEDEKELDNQDFHLTLDAMAICVYDWTKALLKAELFASDTRVISFTSEGNVKAWSNYGAVSAAKAALEAIHRNMALEFASKGIKSNCIQAGVTETNSFKMIPGSETLKQNAIARNPNGRLTTPEDIANVVSLLCKEEAKWITGTVIKADGGESLQ